MDLSFESNNDDITNDDNIEVQIAQTISTGENATVNVVSEGKKVRNTFNWRILSEYDKLDDALDFLERENFVCYDCSDLKSGQKFYFRCKKIPKERKVWCAQRYTLFLPSNNTKSQILTNQYQHDHEKLLEGCKVPPSDEMKEFITDLFKTGTTKIADVIRHTDYARSKHNLFTSEANPGKRQIEYMLKKFRDAEAPATINLGDMIEWLDKHREYPSDENCAFVIGSESSSLGEDLSFGFAFSTPLLLKLLMDCKTICIDATYKLNWLGFPLMVLGTVDRAKKFHPLVYACCSHERTLDYTFIFECVKESIKKHFSKQFEPEKLIADAADAIRNAFYDSYESAQLDIMCYAHVIRNCMKRPFASKANKPLILDDIRKMQLAPNKQTFKMMSNLFCKKWRVIECDFVTYFEREWLGPHCNWFEGAADYTPSTNNGQESHNATIKKKITLRRRLPMNQFLVTMRDMTSDISKEFAKKERYLATEPTIQRETYENATRLIVQNFKSFKAKNSCGSVYTYSVPSSGCAVENATETYYKTLVRTIWKSFDEFIIHGYQQFYIVQYSQGNWKTQSTCTCAAFFKQHMCKHIIAIGIRHHALEIPASSNPTRLMPIRRKPGRPKNTTYALAKQK